MAARRLEGEEWVRGEEGWEQGVVERGMEGVVRGEEEKETGAAMMGGGGRGRRRGWRGGDGGEGD